MNVPDRPKKTILIIEDDARQRDLCREILENAGFAVVAVGDAADALSQLSRGVDLVLLDLVMPGARMDGFAFLLEVRAHPDLVDTPVIILSGLGDAVVDAIDPVTATTLRIASVVAKPVMMTELLRQVQVLLDRPRGSVTPHERP